MFDPVIFRDGENYHFALTILEDGDKRDLLYLTHDHQGEPQAHTAVEVLQFGDVQSWTPVIRNTKWHDFDFDKGTKQPLPNASKFVVVHVPSTNPVETPTKMAIGYLAYTNPKALFKNVPYFIVPGIGGPVLRWCDCLPADFTWPEVEK